MKNKILNLKRVLDRENYCFLYENMRRRVNDYYTFVPRYKNVFGAISCLPKGMTTLMGFFACGCVVSETEICNILGMDLVDWLISVSIVKRYKQKLWMDGYVITCYNGRFFLVNSPSDYENCNQELSAQCYEGNFFSVVRCLELYKGGNICLVNDELGILATLIAKGNLIYLFNENSRYSTIRNINYTLNEIDHEVKFVKSLDLLNKNVDVVIAFPNTSIVPPEIILPSENNAGKDGMESVKKILIAVEEKLKDDGKLIMAGTTILNRGETVISSTITNMYENTDVSIYYQEELFLATYIEMLSTMLNRFNAKNKNVSKSQWLETFGKYKNCKIVNFILFLKKRYGQVKEYEFGNGWSEDDIPKCDFNVVERSEAKYILHKNDQGLEFSYDMYKWMKKIDGERTIGQIIDIVENSAEDLGVFEREGFVANLCKLEEFGLLKK